MKVRLFNPPVHHYGPVQYRMNPALGLPILAAVLDQAGHDAAVIDLEALGVNPQGLGALFIEQHDQWPDVVGFTVTQHNARGAQECIAALRGAGFGGYILLGGPQITAEARLGNVPGALWGADAWVVGECEGNIASVVTLQPRGVVQGEPMALEQIPGPLWTKHTPAPTFYSGNMPKVGHPEGIAMWSRGCPHNCIFCGNPVFGHQAIRTRTPRQVYDDMAALKALGVKSVFVYDDELVGFPKQHAWLREVCAKIAPLGMTWKAQGRCTTKIDKETLQAMYDAGCRAIMWGIESFSERVLKAIKKGTSEEDIWHTLRLAHEVGIGNWLFLMVGNYTETAQDLAYTKAALERASAEGLAQWRQVTVCSPVPGTELYRLAQEEGWLVEQPETQAQMAEAYAPTPWLSTRELRYWQTQLRGAGL